MEKKVVRKIEGFDYHVDTLGNVYSDHRGGKILSQFSYLGGTPTVQLFVPETGGKVIRPVSRLVAEAFLDNPMALRYVVHKDGNNQNNRVENLMWSASKKMDPMLKGEKWKDVPDMEGVKVSSRSRVKYNGVLIKPVQFSGIWKVNIPEHGTRTVALLKSVAFRYSDRPKGNRNILTAEQVAEIKRDYRKGEISLQKMGDKYGVSKTCIHQVVTGKSFPYIKPAEDLENKVLRADSPFDALNALKASIPVEVPNDDLAYYIMYVHRKTKGLYLCCEENAYNEGFTVIMPK
jgi:hypothetical protein